MASKLDSPQVDQSVDEQSQISQMDHGQRTTERKLNRAILRAENLDAQLQRLLGMLEEWVLVLEGEGQTMRQQSQNNFQQMRQDMLQFITWLEACGDAPPIRDFQDSPARDRLEQVGDLSFNYDILGHFREIEEMFKKDEANQTVEYPQYQLLEQKLKKVSGDLSVILEQQRIERQEATHMLNKSLIQEIGQAQQSYNQDLSITCLEKQSQQVNAPPDLAEQYFQLRSTFQELLINQKKALYRGYSKKWTSLKNEVNNEHERLKQFIKAEHRKYQAFMAEQADQLGNLATKDQEEYLKLKREHSELINQNKKLESGQKTDSYKILQLEEEVRKLGDQQQSRSQGEEQSKNRESSPSFDSQVQLAKKNNSNQIKKMDEQQRAEGIPNSSEQDQLESMADLQHKLKERLNFLSKQRQLQEEGQFESNSQLQQQELFTVQENLPEREIQQICLLNDLDKVYSLILGISPDHQNPAKVQNDSEGSQKNEDSEQLQLDDDDFKDDECYKLWYQIKTHQIKAIIQALEEKNVAPLQEQEQQPNLAQQLETLQAQLVSTQQQLAEFTEQKTSLDLEIGDLKKRLDASEQDLKQERDASAALQNMIQTKSEELERTKKEMQSNLSAQEEKTKEWSSKQRQLEEGLAQMYKNLVGLLLLSINMACLRYEEELFSASNVKQAVLEKLKGGKFLLKLETEDVQNHFHSNSEIFQDIRAKLEQSLKDFSSYVNN